MNVKIIALVIVVLSMAIIVSAVPTPPNDYGSVIVEETNGGFAITFTNQADEQQTIIANKEGNLWFMPNTHFKSRNFLLSSCMVQNPECITHVVTFNDLDSDGKLHLTHASRGSLTYQLKPRDHPTRFEGEITIDGETFYAAGDTSTGDFPAFISAGAQGTQVYNPPPAIIGLKGKKLIVPKAVWKQKIGNIQFLYLTDPATSAQYTIPLDSELTVENLEFYPFDAQTSIGTDGNLIAYREKQKLTLYYPLDSQALQQDLSFSPRVCEQFPKYIDTSRKPRCLQDYALLKANPYALAQNEGIAHKGRRQFHTTKSYTVQVVETTGNSAVLIVNEQRFPLDKNTQTVIGDGSTIILHAIDSQTGTAYIELGKPSDTKLETPTTYPHFFGEHGKLNAIVVVGDQAPGSDVVAATDVMSSLQKLYPATRIGITRLASIVPELGNIISIGNPCDNVITKQITQTTEQPIPESSRTVPKTRPSSSTEQSAWRAFFNKVLAFFGLK